MPENQWKMQGDYKPWYIGWNVCEKTKNDILQQFHQTPFFLPKDSINLASTITRRDWKGMWIFMGTTHSGAPFHLDNVKFPSWQAQVLVSLFVCLSGRLHRNEGKLVSLFLKDFT